MIVIGLTGSIGMGKTAVSAMFRKMRIPVFDADAVVHQLQGPGGSLVAAIEARFPGTAGTAGVDRLRLGAAVLGQPAALKALEQLVHPAVADARASWLRHHRSRPIVVLDIPLLFETGGEKRVDLVAVVSAPAWMQRRRVLARPGMTPAKFRQIRALQTPDIAKRRRANIVIETGCLRIATQRRIRHLVACLAARKGR
jgi:dephospho-CoA kinase